MSEMSCFAVSIIFSASILFDGMLLSLANGRQIEVTQYSVDLEKERIQFKTVRTGLIYTIPLEYLETIEDETGMLFRNEKLVEARLTVDDGGIAANFKVTSTSVGGGGGGRSGSGQRTPGDPQWVPGYTRSNGKQVDGYWRDDPSDRDGVGDNKNR